MASPDSPSSHAGKPKASRKTAVRGPCRRADAYATEMKREWTWRFELQTQAPSPAQNVKLYHSGGRVGRHFHEIRTKHIPEKWVENGLNSGRMYVRRL